LVWWLSPSTSLVPQLACGIVGVRVASKKEKALLRRRRNAYIRWVREMTRRVVSHE